MRSVVTGVLIVMLAGLQYRLWIAEGGIAHTHRLKSELQAQRDDNEKLKARNAAMDAEIKDLKSGFAAIEGRARSSLGMIKQDETFYLVVEKS
jgi:cell division protein FtsB